MSSRVRFSFVLWWITSYCGNMNNATAARIRTSFAVCFERRVEPQLNANGVHLMLAALSGTRDDGDAPQNTPAFTEQTCSVSGGDEKSNDMFVRNWMFTAEIPLTVSDANSRLKRRIRFPMIHECSQYETGFPAKTWLVIPPTVSQYWWTPSSSITG